MAERLCTFSVTAGLSLQCWHRVLWSVRPERELKDRWWAPCRCSSSSSLLRRFHGSSVCPPEEKNTHTILTCCLEAWSRLLQTVCIFTLESATFVRPSSLMRWFTRASFSLWGTELGRRRAAEKRRFSLTVRVPITTSSWEWRWELEVKGQTQGRFVWWFSLALCCFVFWKSTFLQTCNVENCQPTTGKLHTRLLFVLGKGLFLWMISENLISQLVETKPDQ